jgi:hypothetical protein
MRNLDLKDLEILDAVYKTRNVSQASDKVELSQPSISIRLGRLRKHFGDPLFVRTSAGMQPTPRADALIPAIQQALALFDGSLRQQDAFDPRTSDRKFRICMTDVGQFVTLPLVLDRMKSAAPSVRIEVLTLNADTVRPAKAGASSGRQSHRGKSRSPVAWVAGLQLGNQDSEAYRRAIVRMAASHQAVAQANERWPRNFQPRRPSRQ